MKLEHKGKSKYYFTLDEWFKEKNKTGEKSYLKGLGALEPDEYKELLFNPNTLEINSLDDLDMNMLDIVFGEDASKRKEWLLN
jgi:DNA gyrase/topoisomerase IV subunit B